MFKERQRLMFGPIPNDLQEGINIARMREERAAKARAVMKKEGVPALLVTGSPNLHYLASFTWCEFAPQLCYALFFVDHDTVVYAHAGYHLQMFDQAPWIKEWRCARAWLNSAAGPEATREEAKLFAQEIRDELKQRGLANEKLGIVDFDNITLEALRNEKINVIDGWPLMLEATKIKTIDEINCLAMAATFCGAGWQKFHDICRPGMSGAMVNRQVNDYMASLGAGTPGGFLMSGPHTFPRNMLMTSDRILEVGNMIAYPLCSTSYMGYTSCCYRTFKVGQAPTQKEKDWYKAVLEVLDGCIDASRVGNTTADAAKCFPPASKWGYKDEVEVLSVEIGHGIGLATLSPYRVAYNLPIINRQWSLKYPQPFEEGMVIAYEALEGEFRVGGCRFENMIVITKDGPEILDIYPRDEIITVGI